MEVTTTAAAEVASETWDKEVAHDKETPYRACGEDDSSRAHSLPHGTDYHILHGQRTILSPSPRLGEAIDN